MILFTPFDDGQIIQPRGGRTTVDVVQVRQSLYFFIFQLGGRRPRDLKDGQCKTQYFPALFPSFFFLVAPQPANYWQSFKKLKISKKVTTVGGWKKEKRGATAEGEKG